MTSFFFIADVNYMTNNKYLVIDIIRVNKEPKLSILLEVTI